MLWNTHPAWPRTLQDWKLLLHVIPVVIKVRFLLQHTPLPEIVTCLTSQPFGTKPDWTHLTRAATFIDGLLERFPAHPKGNCLPRSLALLSFANRYGIPVQFHCGIRKSPHAELEGHAWLSRDQEPFSEKNREVDQYAITYSFPSDSKMTTGPSNVLSQDPVASIYRSNGRGARHL